MKQTIYASIFLLVLLCLSSSSFSANWLTDFEIAKKRANTENKPIILVFQGSDWCAPCRKLEKKVWHTPDFESHADKNYVLLKADFPRKSANQLSEHQQKANEALAEKYNPNGHFPSVVVLNGKGEILGVTGYKPLSADRYIKMLDGFVR